MDCLLLIAERLDFVDLLSIAQINGQLSTLASDVYRCKYAQQWIIVDEWQFELPDKLQKLMNETVINTDAVEQINAELLSDRNKAPKIRTNLKEFLPLLDYETVLMTFKHFGREIKRLKTRINSRSGGKSPFKKSLMGFLISRYISESLVDMEFVYRADDLLKHITRPLINVENVVFREYMYDVTVDFVQRVQTLLPRMKRLELLNFEQTNGRSQFGNVTTLVIRDGSETSSVNLQFPQLQILHMDYVNERFADYLTFLNEHSHLRELHVTGLYMDGSQFQQLTENLNDLVEVTLEYKYPSFGIQKLSPTAIAEFLRSHDKVKQLNAINFSNASINELQNRLKHKWNRKVNVNDVYFERK